MSQTASGLRFPKGHLGHAHLAWGQRRRRCPYRLLDRDLRKAASVASRDRRGLDLLQLLPVGGIREKALAARRFGIKTFVLPAMNEPDLAELPEELRRDMTFVPAETLDQVLKVAFEGPAARGEGRAKANQP